MSRAWNDEALAITKKIIHFQDKLTASLSLALYRGIDQRNYGLVLKLLDVIAGDALILNRLADDLYTARPRRRQGGRMPRFVELAIDLEILTEDIQKTISQVRREAQGNYWKIVGTLLRDCLKRCRRLQHDMIASIPNDKRPTEEYTIVKYADEIMDTIEMGKTEGARWRRVR